MEATDLYNAEFIDHYPIVRSSLSIPVTYV